MTFTIIAITVLISFLAFRDVRLMNRLLLSPYGIVHRKEWYRLLTHSFVHADYMHLIINMLVFFSFGIFAENIFSQLEQAGYISCPYLHFASLYFGGAVISSLTTVRKQRNNPLYQGVGASGGVSAVVFISIFFQPLNNLMLMGIIPIPAIIFGVGYLV
jgi:membrane associated rhomboid family serine protease